MLNRRPHQQFLRTVARICAVGILISTSFAGGRLNAQNFVSESDPMPANVCDLDELWIISSRNLPDCQACVDTSRLVCERWINGNWQCASLSQLTTLHKTDCSKETVIYAHGNRTDEEDARFRGIEVYHNLFDTCPPRPPLRFVIWMWRSEQQVRRPKPDFIIKSKRAIAFGRTFDAMLHEFGQHPPLLIGYSLGTQLIAAGLTDNAAAGLPSYRFAAIAPVLDCDFAGKYYDPLCECERVKSLVIMTNHKDRVIRLAKHTCRKKSGCNFQSFEEWATGNGSRLGNVRQIDVTPTSNAHHSILMYTSQQVVKSAVYQLLMENASQDLATTN